MFAVDNRICLFRGLILGLLTDTFTYGSKDIIMVGNVNNQILTRGSQEVLIHNKYHVLPLDDVQFHL